MSTNGSEPQAISPSYIKALHTRRAQTGDPVSKRKVWGLSLGEVWLPYFMATNAVGVTQIPSPDLGAPLRLRLDKAGAVRLSETGKPSFSVAESLRDEVRVLQSNFVASLVGFTGQVQAEHEGEYTDQAYSAREMGRPIMERDNQMLAMALDTFERQRAEQAQSLDTKEAVSA